ncbi:SDR family oxidoreductase [Pseudooceanicola sp.]|uniref:SDR family NAD(P)-dependent oxidoreductase n=1 Tax=Pseudooceanicola sp. TaxID=1914328 RepID=UPI00261EA6E0|nr:SDR family oxidoreductase [Pseudooceanicola sp.]MDF1854451.1 SDR family oxidoreductase [Pseudooceanicola sp.]
MELQLKGKRALITGGSRGIGLAVARTLAAEGVAVALVGRDVAAAKAAAAAVTAEFGTQAIAAPCDTGSDTAVPVMAAAVIADLGGIDILVNSAAAPAGQKRPPRSGEVTQAHLEAHMNVKVMGYLRAAQAVMPGMVAQGWGRIISISGTGMYRPGDMVGAIRNAGVVAMSKNLAADLAGTGVTTSVLHPGMTRTENVDAMLAARAQEQGRSFDAVLADMAANTLNGTVPSAEDMANIVAFLASPLSSAINGEVITATGGRPGMISY